MRISVTLTGSGNSSAALCDLDMPSPMDLFEKCKKAPLATAPGGRFRFLGRADSRRSEERRMDILLTLSADQIGGRLYPCDWWCDSAGCFWNFRYFAAFVSCITYVFSVC